MRNKFFSVLVVFSIIMTAFILLGPSMNAQNTETQLTLAPTGPTEGPYGLTGQTGQVTIEVNNRSTTLTFSVSGLRPNSVNSLWLILDTQRPPFLTNPLRARDPKTGTTAEVYGFSPGAVDNAGYTAGNGLDPNGFETDKNGNAEFVIELNYDIFQPQVSPVVLRPGLVQTVPNLSPDSKGVCGTSDGSNFASYVDSNYMRVFDTSTEADPPGVSPSYQVLEGGKLLRPRLVRANVSALVLADHFDGLTHGHIPGWNILDPVARGCGDWAPRLSGNLPIR